MFDEERVANLLEQIRAETMDMLPRLQRSSFVPGSDFRACGNVGVAYGIPEEFEISCVAEKQSNHLALRYSVFCRQQIERLHWIWKHVITEAPVLDTSRSGLTFQLGRGAANGKDVLVSLNGFNITDNHDTPGATAARLAENVTRLKHLPAGGPWCQVKNTELQAPSPEAAALICNTLAPRRNFRATPEDVSLISSR